MRIELTCGKTLEITTVAERPQLAGQGFDAGEWPEFMHYNRVADAYFGRTRQVFPQVCLVATTEDGTVVAAAHAVLLTVPDAWHAALPSGGWEVAVVQAFLDVEQGVRPDTACALDISVAVGLQGNGLARLMLSALRTAAANVGAVRLLAPVRPTWKAREPRTPMAEYALRVRDDGMPYDPWLRTHVRVGGQIDGIASTSWVIAGSLAQWRSWTGLQFEDAGEADVPGGLTPVHCDTRSDHAVYVEPNIWVRHDLDG